MRLAAIPVIFSLALLACAADTPKVRPPEWAQPVVGSALSNFCKVSDELYRSEQPSLASIPDLKSTGVHTLLSLRHYHNDAADFEHNGLTLLHYPMDAGSASIPDLIKALRLFQAAKKPVLVHCWHGSDRTGFVVAGYRIVFMNWSPDQAIEELRLGGFGYHAATYPNIVSTLKTMDVAAVRKAVLAE